MAALLNRIFGFRPRTYTARAAVESNSSIRAARREYR